MAKLVREKDASTRRQQKWKKKKQRSRWGRREGRGEGVMEQ